MPEKAVKETLEMRELRAQLEEAQETLNAIRRGEVDGLVISTPKGEQVYSISGAETPYRVLMENMREGAITLSDNNIILYCNLGFAKMMKVPLEKIVGNNIENMVSQTFKAAFKELLAKCRSGPKQEAETKGITFIANDKTLVPTQISVNSLKMDHATTTFIVVTDLTQHMEEDLKRYTSDLEKAGAALFESEQRWSTTLGSIGDAVIATDMVGKITYMNAVAEELTGWSLRKAIGGPVQAVFKIISEATRKTVDDPVAKVLKKGYVVGLANHTLLIRQDGTEVAIDDSGAPIKGKDGKIIGVVLIFRDITERRKGEVALNRINEELEERVQKRTEEVSSERQRLYRVLETLPAYVVLLDKDYRMPFANKVFRETFGESHGRRCHEYLFGRDSECENCETYKVLKTNKPQHWEWTGPNKHNYEIYDYPFVEADGSTLILEMGIDVTERKKAEREAQEAAKKLKDSERLAAIGATAGMVGHDIRNPLQAITGDLYLAREELKGMPSREGKQAMEESLIEIEKNVEYINKIVADLQDFARPLNPRVEETNIKLVIDDLLKKNGLPDNIKVKVNVESDARKVMADSTFINRIMYNLVNNAVQAMPKGGDLTILVYKEVNDVVVKVKDTGIGIPESIKDKLFTPMFTTKAKGQGFGLAVIKRMAEALGGTVSFESQEGKGTTFTVRFVHPRN